MILNIKPMSEKAYRALDTTHIYASMLKTLSSQSAKHLGIRKESEAMSFGTAVHMYLLEPSKFKTTYIERPEFKPLSDKMKEKYGDVLTHYSKTTEYKEQATAFEATVGARTVISITDMERLRNIKRSLKATPKGKALYERFIVAGDSELSVVEGTMPFGDKSAPAKARLDNMVIEGDTGYIVDVKSCQSAKRGPFKYDSKKWGYDIQGAFYHDLVSYKWRNMLTHIRFLFCAVETSPPYNVGWYEMGSEMYEEGKRKYGAVIGEAIDVINGGEKKGYSSAENIEEL